MTDISNWRSALHIRKVHHQDPWDGRETEHYVERIMVPLNDYQMGNLIDAIAQVPDTGDWYGEFCDIVAAAMRLGGIKELRSNNDRTFTLAQVESRDIREKAT